MSAATIATIAHLLREGDVLEAVDDEGHLLGLGGRLRVLRHLLEVVDHHDELASAGQLLVLLDQRPDVVDGACRLRPPHQEEVLAVAADPVEARPEARVRRELRPGPALAVGDPRAEDLAAHVLDLDGARLVREVGQRRFHGDEPVEEVVLLVLEADVEDVRLAARGDVARHLQGHRRLAGSLGTADQEELARAQARADRLVQRGEAQRDRLVVGQVAGDDPVVQVHQDVEGGPGHEAPGVGVKAPLRLRPTDGGLLSLGAHACTRSPGVADSGAGPRAEILAPAPGPNTLPEYHAEARSTPPIRCPAWRRSRRSGPGPGSRLRSWRGPSTRSGHGSCRSAA